MKKNKKQKKVNDTLSKIDGVLAALNAYPNLEDAVLDQAQQYLQQYLGKFFPTQLDFVKLILEHICGTGKIVEILGYILTGALPEIELALKGVLLANMANLGTLCEIDPIIREKAIKEGILFDLKQIDLMDRLTVSPLDKSIGQYYYFGIEGCESSYDILQSAISPNNQTERRKNKVNVKEKHSALNRFASDNLTHMFGGRKRDFDCLLWYMKNKAAYREVWGKRNSLSEDIFNGGGKIEEYLEKKGSKETAYYEIDGNNVNFWTYKDGKWVRNLNDTKPSGEMIAIEEGTKYIYHKTNNAKGKVYSYGNPSFKKLNRKNYYYVKDKGVYYFDKDEKEWKLETDIKGGSIGYEYMEKLPTSIQEGNFAKVNGIIYRIDSNPKKGQDKKGNEYVKSIKSTKCTDITNDFNENLFVFVDYDLFFNAESEIKNGEAIKKHLNVTSSLDVTNVGTLSWKKFKEDDFPGDTTFENIGGDDGIMNCNCYYIKKGVKNDKYVFDESVDEIVIPPYYFKDTLFASDSKTVKTVKECVNLNNKMEEDNKYTKDFGILTLDFNPRAGNVLQSDGKPMLQQTPYDNVLHVFFGNVKELPDSERTSKINAWRESADANKIGSNVKTFYEKLLKKFKNEKAKKEKEWKKGIVTVRNVDEFHSAETDLEKYKLSQQYENAEKREWKTVENLITYILNGGKELKGKLTSESSLYNDTNGLTEKLNTIYNELDNMYDGMFIGGVFDYEISCKLLTSFIDKVLSGYSISAYIDRSAEINETNESAVYYLSAKNLQYPEAKKNYYYKHILQEFNIDYVTSLQLFDPKVLAAQLISSLFSGVSMSIMPGMTPSWKTELVRDTVKSMVEKQIAAEDYEVSDCFFTFTNDSYNGMLRAAELRQAGLYSSHGEENGNNKIDPLKLLEGLNNINEDTDLQEQKTIIEGAIMNASVEIAKDSYAQQNGFEPNINLGVQMNFFETMLTNLCTQLVMSMLTPKVYLLIMINFHMFGITTSLDIKAFLAMFAKFIKDIVKSIVDKVIEKIMEEIMKIIEEILQKLVIKLRFEQVEMYARLLKQIFMHLKQFFNKFKGQDMAWAQDMVGYADIVGTEDEEPINEEC